MVICFGQPVHNTTSDLHTLNLVHIIYYFKIKEHQNIDSWGVFGTQKKNLKKNWIITAQFIPKLESVAY